MTPLGTFLRSTTRGRAMDDLDDLDVEVLDDELLGTPGKDMPAPASAAAAPVAKANPLTSLPPLRKPQQLAPLPPIGGAKPLAAQGRLLGAPPLRGYVRCAPAASSGPSDRYPAETTSSRFVRRHPAASLGRYYVSTRRPNARNRRANGQRHGTGVTAASRNIVSS